MQVAHAKKDFSYVKLNQPARKEKLTQWLCEAAGKTVGLEILLEGDRPDAAMASTRADAQQTLIDTFGRENVQIDEGKN